MLAAPAAAEIRAYAISGDVSAEYPISSDGTVMHPGAAIGSMILSDDGAGTVTLGEFTVRMAFTDTVGGTVNSLIPGTTIVLDTDTTARIDTGQTGSGSLRGTLDWGVLTGWTQTGYLYCAAHCPGGCGIGTVCIPFINFQGTGPPTDFKSDAFYTDTWRFDAFGGFLSMGRRCPGGSAIGPNEPDPTDPNDPSVCQADSDCPGNCTDGQGNTTFPCPCTDTLEIVFLEPAPGVILRRHLRIAGNPVPALGLMALVALGAALVYAGAAAVRRRSR